MRLIIGPGAAELAALRAGPPQVAGLQAALRDMRDALDASPPDHEAYNFAFNAAIRVPGLARSSLPRHQAILDAIRRRQPNRARAAMSRLVQNTGRAIGKLGR